MYYVMGWGVGKGYRINVFSHHNHIVHYDPVGGIRIHATKHTLHTHLFSMEGEVASGR